MTSDEGKQTSEWTAKEPRSPRKAERNLKGKGARQTQTEEATGSVPTPVGEVRLLMLLIHSPQIRGSQDVSRVTGFCKERRHSSSVGCHY